MALFVLLRSAVHKKKETNQLMFFNRLTFGFSMGLL